MKQLRRLRKWLKYITYRRAYWDAIIMYGIEDSVTDHFAAIMSRYATFEQVQYAVKYGEKLQKKFHGTN